MNRLRSAGTGVGVVVATALFFAGCSDDDPAGPGGDSLTAAEAAAVSQFMAQAAFDGWDPSAVGSGGGGAALESGSASGVPTTIDFSLDVGSACPLGGAVGVAGAVSGTIDDETGTGDISINVATSATDCAFAAEGSTFTVSTEPDLVLDGTLLFANGQLVGESTFTYAGGLAWSADDGRSGSCSYDVTVTLSADGTVVESGTVCGAAV